jgi:hypothetical protein
MNTFYLQLLWFPEVVTTKGFRDGRRAYIALKCETREKCRTETGDLEFLVISPECRSPGELQDAAMLLIRELLSVCGEGCQFLGDGNRHLRE